MFDFFVSHSSVDKSIIVDQLVNKLENMGYSIWYDKNCILPGDSILSTIKKGLSDSYCLILVVTDNFVKSKWTFYETGFYDSLADKRIIPLIYNLSDNEKEILYSVLGDRKYLDLSSLSIERIAVELSRALQRVKNSNSYLKTINQIKSIQTKLASYETVNSMMISVKLKQYLEFIENNNDFLFFAAKQIVRLICFDIINLEKNNYDYSLDDTTLLSLIQEKNVCSLNMQEYIRFIMSINVEKNNYDNVIILNHALANILVFYLHTKYPFFLSFSEIEVVYPNELTYNDFLDMYEIDRKVMREDLIANVATTFAWYKHNNYTHIAVKEISSQKTIGYFAILPVTDETYNQIISGDFKDKDFTSENIEQYIFSNFYRIYVAGVGIDPDYQNTGAFIKLYNALIDMFLLFAKDREIYVSEVLAEASTKQGEKFCKMIGMKRISNTQNDTDIYRLVTIPPEFRLKNKKGKELFDLCQRKYQEYKDFFTNNE